jgi:hypothetical protein
MKTSLLILFGLICFSLKAQVILSGKVIDEKNNPLLGASVYLNNTTIGTSTDADGYFKLSVEHGYHNLIVSYIGFETASYNVNTLDLPEEIVFVLFEKSNQLNEVVVKTKRDSRRGYFLKQFKKSFLGESVLGKQARIKNQEVLRFEYNKKTNILEAFADEPLIVENRGLGYKITYDLVHFELDGFKVSYLGFKRYEPLEGNERKQRKWERERKKAYNGSLRHFLTSAIQLDSLAGFEVELIRLIPNPDRPTESDIAEAEAFVSKHGGLQRNPYDSDPNIEKKLKLANEILKKAEKLNRFIHMTIRAKVPIQDYFKRTEDGMFLVNEEEAMRIRYRNEYQESNYKSPDETRSSRNHQVSRITFYDERILVNSMGLFHNPLDALLEGYWAFEKVADQLPLDYKH